MLILPQKETFIKKGDVNAKENIGDIYFLR